MTHDHPHDTSNLSDRRIIAAIAFNLLLTVVEGVGGILSGSLSLVADALHNLNDCGSLVIALIARRIARRPADHFKTFGYRRAEVIGALINLTVLIVVAIYLVYEAVARFIDPQEIEGWTVVIIAGIALLVDVATAAMLFTMSRGSMNVRAAFLHNVSDALASLGVIAVGATILLWKFYLLDVLVTLLIASYILWQSINMMRQAIHILMQGVPTDLDIAAVASHLCSVDGVREVHHVHVWQLDEHERSLEAHVVISQSNMDKMPEIKCQLKAELGESFGIRHSTLEFEFEGEHNHDDHDRSVVADH